MKGSSLLRIEAAPMRRSHAMFDGESVLPGPSTHGRAGYGVFNPSTGGDRRACSFAGNQRSIHGDELHRLARLRDDAVARHGLPSPRRYDDKGKLRVIAKVWTFSGLVDAAFNQIRQFCAESVAVSLRLLEVLASIAEQLRTDDQRKAVVHHVEMVYRQSCKRVHEPSDLTEIKVRYRSALAALHAENISTNSPA